MKPVKTSTVLRKARALVNKGWYQGGFGCDAEGQKLLFSELEQATKFCIYGGILRAAALLKTNFRPAHLVVKALLPKRKDGNRRIPMGYGSFNDTPGRTKREILDVLDRAIARVAKQEART